MKKSILFVVLVFSSLLSFSQTVEEIYDKMIQTSLGVKTGYCEISRSVKYMTDLDTNREIQNLFFQKINKDNIFPLKFAIKYYSRDTLRFENLYDGKKMRNVYYRDSTAKVFSYNDLKKDRDYYFDDLELPEFTKQKLSNSDSLKNEGYTLELLGEKNINNRVHYVVRVYSDSVLDIQVWDILRRENIFEIDKEDCIITNAKSIVTIYDKTTKDTIYQYTELSLVKYKLDIKLNSNIFEGNDIPKYFKIEKFSFKAEKEKEEKENKMLEIGEIAPDLDLTTIEGKKIKLSELKTKVILLDFFYRSCPPCMFALPILDSIYEEYKEKGIVIVGIDPMDSSMPIKEFKDFISKKGIKYDIAFLDRKIVFEQYKVRGYPTLYILGKDRNVEQVFSGYSEDMGNTLRKTIDGILEK
ncbi:MAG: hypothetical protein H6Q15_31 [Bacteroidetes bacterium]|nr:hypothetical protein [Bacteroidota bacterium]